MSDEILSEGDLEALVKDTILAAVERGERSTDAPRPDNSVVVGDGAAGAIRRAVLSAVHDLIGQQMLTAGPLKNAAEKLNGVSAQTEMLWEALKAAEKALDERLGATGQQKEQEATKPAKVEAKPPAIVVDATPENVAAKVEPAKVEPAKVEPAKVEPAKTTSAEDSAVVAAKKAAETGDLMFNGVAISFFKKTPETFKSFLREFVSEITKGPVRPSWAMLRARAHGWNVVRGTVLEQVENYLGDISKWADERGDSWWSLPEHGKGPAGTVRKGKAR